MHGVDKELAASGLRLARVGLLIKGKVLTR